MKYRVTIKDAKFSKDIDAKLRLKLDGTVEDCSFVYRVITFGLGNPQAVEEFMDDKVKEYVVNETDEDDSGGQIGFQ